MINPGIGGAGSRPAAMDNLGAMGSGAVGSILPSGGYTDPPEEMWGVGFGGAAGAYAPHGQGYTDPTDEQSAGSCGSGGGGFTNPSCARF